MKSVSTTFFLLVILSSCFVSCEEELVVKHTQDTKIVVNAILEVDQPIKVEVSKTRNILDQDDAIDWIRNADVYLRGSGNLYDEQLVYEGNGIFASQQIGKYSEVYDLEISHPSYEDVSATAAMPDKAKGQLRRIIIEEANLSQSFFELEIENETIDNYYIWEMFYETETQQKVSITSLDNKTDNILPDETQSREKIFMNAAKVNAQVLNSSFVAENLGPENELQVKVRLFSVNEDMYNYYKSLELYKNSVNNYIEPVEIFSNINNGLGIFGAYSESVIDLSQ